MLESHFNLIAKYLKLEHKLGGDLFLLKNRKLVRHPKYFKRKRLFKRRIRLYFLFLVVLIIQGVQSSIQTSSSKWTRSNSFRFLLIAFTHILGYNYVQCNFKQRSVHSAYMNGLLAFYEAFPTFQHIGVNLPFISKYNVIFANSAYLSVVGLPVFFVFVLHWVDPCCPSLVGSFLLDECHKSFEIQGWIWIVTTFTWKLAIFAVNYFFAAVAFAAAGMSLLATGTVCTVCFTEYIRGYTAAFQRTYESQADYILGFRTLQVLGTMLCESQKDAITLATVPASIGAQCVGLTALVKMRSGGTLMPFIMGVFALNGFLSQVLTVGMMSKVFVWSRYAIGHCKRTVLRNQGSQVFNRKGRLAMRYIRSLAPIKVSLGSINFVDGMTPLVCVQFANELTLQLLLVFGKI